MLNLLAEKITQRKEKTLYRERLECLRGKPGHVIVNDKEYLSFMHNDYLGFGQNASSIAVYQTALQQHGCGSLSSELVAGHSPAHTALESAISEFLSTQACVLFTSAYLANMALIPALAKQDTKIFVDELTHASIFDGILLSRAPFVRYTHNDMDDLASKLESSNATHKLIISNGVFSMRGNIANLSALQKLTAQYNGLLIIDDTHGLGVLGNTGKGCFEACNAKPNERTIITASFAKALGTSGGCIAASNTVIDTVIQFGRAYGYTTALPAPIAATTLHNVNMLQEQPKHLQRLHDNIKYFKQCAKQHNVNVLPSNTAIQMIPADSNEHVLQLAAQLKEKGILVSAIRPPSVPEHHARLRISISASHTKQDIEKLFLSFPTGSPLPAKRKRGQGRGIKREA